MVIVMKIYSHRGESKYAPENTMSAFYLAYLLKSDGIECDVRKTKDNELVLIHDKTIDRTSNSNGKVSDLTINELHNIDFGNKIYKGEKIVKLTDFLNYFEDKDISIFLEIKESGYEKLLWDTISNYNLSNVTIISFKYEILKKLRELSNTLKLGWLIYALNDNIIRQAKEINITNILCICTTFDKKDVIKMKDNNLNIYVWGIKNNSELKRINNLNIDGIICDSSYDAKKVLKNE